MTGRGGGGRCLKSHWRALILLIRAERDVAFPHNYLHTVNLSLGGPSKPKPSETRELYAGWGGRDGGSGASWSCYQTEWDCMGWTLMCYLKKKKKNTQVNMMYRRHQSYRWSKKQNQIILGSAAVSSGSEKRGLAMSTSTWFVSSARQQSTSKRLNHLFPNWRRISQKKGRKKSSLTCQGDKVWKIICQTGNIICGEELKGCRMWCSGLPSAWWLTN